MDGTDEEKVPLNGEALFLEHQNFLECHGKKCLHTSKGNGSSSSNGAPKLIAGGKQTRFCVANVTSDEQAPLTSGEGPEGVTVLPSPVVQMIKDQATNNDATIISRRSRHG